MGGLGNLPWGCRHWGRVQGCLKGSFLASAYSYSKVMVLKAWGRWGSKSSAPVPPSR